MQDVRPQIDHHGHRYVSFSPGADFVAEIDKAIAECALMLVIIGRWWLLNGDEGQPRLHDPNDYGASFACRTEGSPVRRCRKADQQRSVRSGPEHNS